MDVPMKTIICILLLAVALTPAFAGKMYKWIDKQGTVHYTQTPPPQEQAVNKAKEMKVSTNTVKPERKRGKLYCGEDVLPKLKESAAINITNLQQNIYGWEDSIERRKKDRDQMMKRNSYSLKYSTDALARYNREDAEDHCKIGWAKAQLKSMDGDRDKIIDRYHSVNQAIEDVEERKLNECGTDDRSGFIVVDEKYREFTKCNDRYDRELRKLKKEMKNAKRNYDMVNVK